MPGLVHQLTDAFVGTFAAPESAAWARLILREQQDPSEAFDRLYAGVMRRLLALLARLIALVRGTDPQSAETRLLCQTIIGQALVFRSARATVLRHLEWQSDRRRGDHHDSGRDPTQCHGYAATGGE